MFVFTPFLIYLLHDILCLEKYNYLKNLILGEAQTLQPSAIWRWTSSS